MEKYKYKLPCTPEEMDEITWDNYRDFGEFFKRKKGDMLMGKPLDDDFYGIEFQVGKGYDFFTTSAYEFLWQHGGDIWDETKQPNAHAVGVVNSPMPRSSRSSISSRFVKYMPPEGTTGNLDIFKTDELFRAGKVASNLEWIGFAESSINPETSKVADKVAFAQLPGLKTDKGVVRWSVIGGQPFVLMTWNTDLQNKEALDFVKWWLSKDTQIAYAKAGGQSALKSVYTDPSYVTFRPWNRTWAESLDWQKDFWHIPEFFELLTEQQEEYTKADHRTAGRQDDLGQHRQLRGEAAEGRRAASSRRRPPFNERAPRQARRAFELIKVLWSTRSDYSNSVTGASTGERDDHDDRRSRSRAALPATGRAALGQLAGRAHRFRRRDARLAIALVPPQISFWVSAALAALLRRDADRQRLGPLHRRPAGDARRWRCCF